MQRSSMWLVSSLVLTAACSKPAEKAAEAPPADTAAMAAPAPAPAGPQAIVTVIYKQPKSPAAFEKYYKETHLPLVSSKQQEIGFTKAELTKFTSTLDGKKPTFYRQAELYFDNMDAPRRASPRRASRRWATTSPSSPPAASSAWSPSRPATRHGRLPRTRHGHLQHAQGQRGVRVLLLATHLPLVSAGQQEIGFTRADLTRFESNLDGSAPAEYRQAELCFNSMGELKKGTATPAFKKVGDDLPKFATGGLTALIGEQQ